MGVYDTISDVVGLVPEPDLKVRDDPKYL